MALTLSESLDNLYTTTWRNMKSKVTDNIFDATPFWFWLKKNGGLDTASGGRSITEPLRYAGSENVKFIQKGDTVDLAETEFLTVANYDWRYLVDSIVRFGVDDQQNRGKNQIISLMRAKLDNSRDSLIDRLETSLIGNAAAEANIGFHGLEDIVPEDPTAEAATLGGIDPRAVPDGYPWWRNQYKNMTGVSTAALLLYWMQNMLILCQNNIRMDRPNLILCGPQAYQYYDTQTIAQKQIVNKAMGDGGFTALEYQGIPVVWQPNIDTDRMYWLNTNFLKFRYDPQMYFDMTRWKEIPNQVNDRAAQIVTAGNLVTNRRRCHGIMFNVDTA